MRSWASRPRATRRPRPWSRRRATRRGRGRSRSNVVASQVDIHREWGGVVPELASRQHIRDICGVVERALGDARDRLAELDAIAVTQGPGLVGSLLVGVVVREVAGAGRSASRSCRCTTSPGTSSRCSCEHGALPLPAVVLVVSGGHTSLYLVRSAGRVHAASAGRGTMRRARRTTRWRSCSGSAIRAGRSSTGSRAEGNDTRHPAAGHAADPPGSQRARA